MKSIFLFLFPFLFVLSTGAKDDDPFIYVYGSHAVDSVSYYIGGCRAYYSIPYCSTLPMHAAMGLGISDSVDWFLNGQLLTRTYGHDTFYAA